VGAFGLERRIQKKLKEVKGTGTGTEQEPPFQKGKEPCCKGFQSHKSVVFPPNMIDGKEGGEEDRVRQRRRKGSQEYV